MSTDLTTIIVATIITSHMTSRITKRAASLGITAETMETKTKRDQVKDTIVKTIKGIIITGTTLKTKETETIKGILSLIIRT